MRRVSMDLDIIGVNEENPIFRGILQRHVSREVRGESRVVYVFDTDGGPKGVWASASIEKNLDRVLEICGPGADVEITWLEKIDLEGGKTYNRYEIALDDASADKIDLAR